MSAGHSSQTEPSVTPVDVPSTAMPSELQQRGIARLELEIKLFGSSASGEALRLPGVVASVSPLTPERSIFDSAVAVVVDTAALRDSIEELAGAYEGAGLRAGTVWVGDDERARAGPTERRGHVLDRAPRSMGWRPERPRRDRKKRPLNPKDLLARVFPTVERNPPPPESAPDRIRTCDLRFRR